ncbi:MAG: hypothetical protein KC643_28315, partial [Nitrospira sp.]|nr:hypothetical protein [Nitrospira sp.]
LLGFILWIPAAIGKMPNTNEEILVTEAKPSTHRIIFGTIEGITDTHIKVQSGEVGEMTPRYLEIEKLTGKEETLKVGDRLKIVVGSQNIVQDYFKVAD